MASTSRSGSHCCSSPSITSNMGTASCQSIGVPPNNNQNTIPPPQNITPNSVPIPTPTETPNPDPQTVEATAGLGKRRCQDKTTKGRKQSRVWDCFTRPLLPDGKPDPDNAQCNYCKAIVPASSSKNGTSSCWSHGRNCKVNPLFEKPIEKGQPILCRDNVTGAPQYHKFNQGRIDEKLYKMIIRDELPFRHVEGYGFKEFLYEAQPQWVQPSRKLVAKGVWELYQSEKGKMMSIFAQHAKRVSVTTDTWTSIQNINYMVVTAHFMDSDWKLHKRIINFCSITSHKGEDIGRVLEQCLREWDINRVFTITVDNASSNDLAVVYMKRRLRNMNTLSFDGDFLHLRCACHIINLIVKDGIKELENGIDAIWHCVKFIRSSSSRLDKFREFSVLEHLNKNANVPLDVITRWNSTYLMLDAALKYEKVFGRMADEDAQFQHYFEEKDTKGRKRTGPLVEEDWRNAQAFVHFLKKFYEATLKLSAWKTVTANLQFKEMIGLQTEIDKKASDPSDEILQRVAMGMKAKFDKYWGSFEIMNQIMVIANVLDPRWKLQYQKKAFARVGIRPAKIEIITRDLKNILLRMYDEYRCCEAGLSQSNQSDGVAAMEGLELDDLEDGQAEILVDLMQERLENEHEMISNEVDKYLADRYVNPLVKGFDVSQWWRVNAVAYPTLSKLAKDIFAIPCSTVASENAFSLGKRVVDPFRSSLTPQMVEALICTSDWLRVEQPNFYSKPTTEELSLYKDLEELQKATAALHLGGANSSTTTAL
ncbi:putative transcription factor/ chromatin remodeling BED-type(Zn) family [Rosa chinensis]|uniref:Putative transcription factor/ chromatin remodeling BED-type(Zn) family n=1 Tax=Rosa chinensis TaxID=74649 RepID=A0A2P6RMQ9_ROSCH|nr:putative transcription factor/ chromatin remodeling BED-type(Zn) family [Rosa chinensis]